MSNYHVEPAAKPAALTSEAIKSLRKEQVQGLSRRQLMRGALGAGIGLWLLEVSAGTIGFIWPNLSSGFGAPFRVGNARGHEDPELHPPDRGGVPGVLRGSASVRDPRGPIAAALHRR